MTQPNKHKKGKNNTLLSGWCQLETAHIMFVCYLYWHWPLRGVLGWPSCQPLAGIRRCHALSPPWKCQPWLTWREKDWGWDFPAVSRALCHHLSQTGSGGSSRILNIPDPHCSHPPHSCTGILISVSFFGSSSASLVALCVCVCVVVILRLYLSIQRSLRLCPLLLSQSDRSDWLCRQQSADVSEGWWGSRPSPDGLALVCSFCTAVLTAHCQLTTNKGKEWRALSVEAGRGSEGGGGRMAEERWESITDHRFLLLSANHMFYGSRLFIHLHQHKCVSCPAHPEVTSGWVK